MYRCTAAGDFLYVNPALVRLLGYDSADELLARNLGRDIYADPAERTRLIERYLPRGGVDGARVRWRTKQGKERILQLYCHLDEDAGGAYFDGTVVDVTELETANVE